MTLISFWMGAGVINLLRLTYQDVFKKNTIDNRSNLIMLGVSLALISSTFLKWWQVILGALLIGVMINIFSKAFKDVLAQGDWQSLQWIYLGLFLLNPASLVFFLAIFSVLTLVFYIAKGILKIEKPIAFYPVILGSFIINLFILIRIV